MPAQRERPLLMAYMYDAAVGLCMPLCSLHEALKQSCEQKTDMCRGMSISRHLGHCSCASFEHLHACCCSCPSVATRFRMSSPSLWLCVTGAVLQLAPKRGRVLRFYAPRANACDGCFSVFDRHSASGLASSDVGPTHAQLASGPPIASQHDSGP